MEKLALFCAKAVPDIGTNEAFVVKSLNNSSLRINQTKVAISNCVGTMPFWQSQG
jgi:hypothetical protein